MEAFLTILFSVIVVAVSLKVNKDRLYSDQLDDPSRDEYVPVTVGETALRIACRMLKGTCSKNGTYGKGTLNGLEFSLKVDVEDGYAVFLNHKLPVSGPMSIKRENLVSRFKKDIGKEDVQVGDPYFDERMLLEASDPTWLVAVLNEKTRRLIIQLSEKSQAFSISSSWIRVSLTQYGTPAEKLVRLIKKAAAVSKALSVQGDVKQMLIHNLFYDPEPKVRLSNLQMLAFRYSRSKELTGIYSDAMNDPSIDVQLEAAALLKEKGMKHLLAVLKKKEDAVDVIKIIKLFKDNRYHKSIGTLKELYAERKDTKTRIEILKAFKVLSDEKLSLFLANLVDKHTGPVLPHVVRALGTCGTIESMEKLYSLSKKGSGSKIREEAAAAMAQIQSRLGVDKGWLSVAELGETDGALSMTDEDAEGGLSLTDKKKI